jgi:hypothetical protein
MFSLRHPFALYMQLRLLGQNHDDSTEAAVGQLRKETLRHGLLHIFATRAWPS